MTTGRLPSSPRVTASRGPGHPAAPTAAAPRPAVAVIPVRRIFAIENRNYFLLLGTTLFLVAFGLVMVLSSSSIESSVDGEGFFGRFIRQGFSAILGIPLMLVASRMPTWFASWSFEKNPLLSFFSVICQLFEPCGRNKPRSSL